MTCSGVKAADGGLAASVTGYLSCVVPSTKSDLKTATWTVGVITATCDSGYYLTDASTCTAFGNGVATSAAITSTGCSIGYYYSSANGKCIACTTTHSAANKASGLLTCDSTKVISCKTNYFFSNGICIPC